jgi:CheY-like chemotaxis protein
MDEGELRYVRGAAEFFAGRGHRTEVLQDGLGALERIRAEPPDVLVADVLLRGRDGFELVIELKQRYADRRTGAIIFTIVTAERGSALTMPERSLRSLDALIVKPYAGDLQRAGRHRIV